MGAHGRARARLGAHFSRTPHVLSVLFCYYENYASKRAINYFAFLRYTTVHSLFTLPLQDKLAISEKQYTFSYLEKQIHNPFFSFLRKLKKLPLRKLN